MMQLVFSVRYYPVDPTAEDPIIRTQMYWQVKRDFVDARLPCTPEIAVQLSAYIAQAELCDWLEPREEYLLTLGLHNQEFENLKENIVEQHKKFKGMTPIEAMTEFLDIASRLDFYGMIFFEVKCEEKMPYVLGLSPHGVFLCKEFMIAQSYTWNRLVQVAYKGKRFTLKVTGKWASGSSKPTSVHYDVDSNRTCRELYLTVIEYINFYKESFKMKVPLKGPTQIKIPSSVSTEMLSQVLLKSIENEEERRERERGKGQLQRSLSLPRDTINKLSTTSNPLKPSHPLNSALRPLTVTSTIGPSAHSQERNEEGVSDPSPLSSSQRLDSVESEDDSVHDSLLDLADNLGEDEDEGDVVHLKHERSNSNPEVLIHSAQSQSIEGLGRRGTTASSVSPVGGEEGTSAQKKKNLLMLQKWMKDQQKKDLDDSVTSPQTDPDESNATKAEANSQQSTSSSSLSPSNGYRLLVKKGTPSPPLHKRSSSPYYRPNSAAASSSHHIEDLYSIPRPSPSPGFLRRPHPFSRHHSARSEFLIPSRCSSASHNDYDIPRSLLDLRPVSSQGVSSLTAAQSENSLIGQTSTSAHSLSSIPGAIGGVIDQINALKDEYPDYDIPKPHVKSYPDYDIPKPHKKFSTKESSEVERGDSEEGKVRKEVEERESEETDGPTHALSFGVLDSIMAGIDDNVAAAQQKTSSSSLPSLIDPASNENTFTKDKPIKHIREHSTPIILEAGKREEEGKKKEPVYDHLAAKIALQQLIADGIVKKEDDGGATGQNQQVKEASVDSLQIEATPHIDEKTEALPNEENRSTGSKVSLPELHEVQPLVNEEKKPPLKEEDSKMEENKIEKSKAKKPVPPPPPPSHLADLAMKLDDKEGGMNEKKDSKTRLPNLPFDPQFFARQTALEKGKTPQELPPEVARFMSWVKTGTVPPPSPPPKPPGSAVSPSNSKRNDKLKVKDADGSLEKKKKKSISPIIKRKVTPPVKESKDQQQSKTKETAASPSKEGAIKDIKTPTKQPFQPKEPIYHEIPDPKKESANATTPAAGGETNTQPHGGQSLQQQQQQALSLSGAGVSKKGAEKENKGVPPGAAHFRKDTSLPIIQNTGGVDDSEPPDRFTGKRSKSFNARRPLEIKLPPPTTVGEESIPNSPSFYTGNPQAGAMPSSIDPAEGDKSKLKETLDQIDANSLPQHHNVVNWVQGAQRFWEDTGDSGDKGLSRAKSISRPPLPSAPHNRSLSLSHSFHNKSGQQLVRGPPLQQQQQQAPGGRGGKDFKDHVYEDPDTLLSSSLKDRKATEPLHFASNSLHKQQQGGGSGRIPTHPSSLQHQASQPSGLQYHQSIGGIEGKFFTTGRSRAQSQASSYLRRPYITREHKSSSGGTVYATDV
ncbi:PREDICTED: uncharacterized protein LOC109581247 isoform X2 [Amphimedon queenslandica]|nr:PREDICTED: uncharacterized protein LOC109581247 isoform X2 [Amphimedon queenslandica]|eukprot:XP_019850764.1 PREDICTED: uncharacterized protein LOC109581247 isoform X2 [Amphimedon queenslandica]